MKSELVSLAALLLAACGGPAAAPNIAVRDAWARAVPQAKGSAAVYLTIANTGGTSDRLIGADTPVAAMTMIHETSLAGGVMRMRHAAAGLEVAAAAEIHLKPAGAHIMLMSLKAPLVEGGTIPMTLTFERSGQRNIAVAVTDPLAAGPPAKE